MVSMAGLALGVIVTWVVLAAAARGALHARATGQPPFASMTDEGRRNGGRA